jgi:cell division protein FtsI (penicillin-binding protein 3)
VISSYKLRLKGIFFLFVLLYGVVGVHLYVIQVKQSNHYRTLAKGQYTAFITASPPRAEIVDRYGKPLALNSMYLAAFIIPARLEEPEKVRAFLARYFPQALGRLERHHGAHFMYIKRRLTPEDIELIQQSRLSDIRFLKEPSRFYPAKAIGPIVGVTDTDNRGLSGIELAYDRVLAGSPSTYSLEQEARSGHYYFHKEEHIQGTEGKPVQLTIDSTLQFLAYEELKGAVEQLHASEGAVLIIDPTTGDILVMAQYPDFEPHSYAQADPETMKSKSVTETYELGSVIKIFFALAALEENVVTPDELIDCEDKKVTYIDGMRIGTRKPHGVLTFSQVIELSNNIGTSKVAKRLGERLYEHYRRCGFGDKTALNYLGEQRGFVNPPNLWSKQSVFSLSFGYELRATLLQLACAFGLLATQGVPIRPRLVLDTDATQAALPKPCESPLYHPETITAVREILTKTITQGTAKRAKIDGYTVLGKTGTAELLSNGVYDRRRNIFTFAGLIEKENYKRIVITFIKETDQKHASASTITAPLFERIAQKMLIHEKII